MSDYTSQASADAVQYRDESDPSNELQPLPDLQHYLRQYAKERPEVVALWCFGVGFVLGWKLKPW